MSIWTPSRDRPLDMIDVLLLLWIVVAAIMLFHDAFGDTLGKGSYLAAETVIFLLGVGYLSARRQNLPKLMRWRLIAPGAVPGLLLVTVSSVLLLDGLDRVINLLIPIPAERLEGMMKSLNAGSGADFWLMLLGVGIAAPIAEESLFRGAIQQILERQRGITGGVLLTALFFALIHLKYWWLIQLILMGVLLGYLAWRFDSILPSLLIHAVNNIFSLWVINQPTEELILIYTSGNQLKIWVWGVAAAVFFTGCFIIRKYFSSVRPMGENEQS